MNRTGKMISLAVSMLFVASSIFVIAGAFDTDDGREGTLGAAESISTVEQLIAINTDTALGKDYVLMNDLTLPSNFVPIGVNSTDPFRGKFDGNGYTITLNMNRSSGDAHVYIGLFGYTNNAKIENLNVEGTVISTTTGIFNARAGGIVGSATQTEITNCHFSGKIEATGGNYAYAGGITGYAASDSKIIGCSNTGSVTATSSANPAYAGGITGNAASTEIKECSNTGSVTATSSVHYTHAGGIVGYASGSSEIKLCFNSGSVNATGIATCTHACAGGIAGRLDGLIAGTISKIIDCYNTGSVSANGGDNAIAGGIVGLAGSSEITRCYNVATVTATSDDYAYAGGIGGFTKEDSGKYARINNCFFLEGKVTGDKFFGFADGETYESPRASGDYSSTAMKDQSLYKNHGWDFDDVWEIDAGVNNGFPTLQSNPHAEPQVVPPSGGGGVDIVLIAVIAIVAIGAIGAAVWFFFLRI